MGFIDRLKEQFREDAGLDKVLKLEYLGGHPKITGKEVKIKKGKEPKQLIINRTAVNVTEIEWQEKHERSGGKAAAGAIIGGLATGGLGAIAGAAIGGRKQDKSTAVIIFEEGYKMYVRCGQNEFKELTGML